MSEYDELLIHLKRRMEKELCSGQPYEGMMYCQSFLARKKRLLNGDQRVEILVEGAKILFTNNEYGYASTLIVWFLESDMLDIDKVNYVLELLQRVPPDNVNAMTFFDNLYMPFSNFLERHSNMEGLFMLNASCAPVFEAAQAFRQASRCYIVINDMIGLARVTDALSKHGITSEYPLFFTRAYLYLLTCQSDNSLILSDAFFVESDSEYMRPFLESHSDVIACQCWTMCEMIHDLQGLEDRKISGLKTDKKGIFEALMKHYSALLKQEDPYLLDLMSLVGVHIFKVKLQPKESMNPLHTMIRNMFAGPK